MGQSTLLKPAWALTGSTRRRRHHPRQPSQTLNYAASLRSGQTLDSELPRQDRHLSGGRGKNGPGLGQHLAARIQALH